MLSPHFFSTVNQKVLSFLARYSDQEFYERQIAQCLGIAYGSANRSLNQLYSTGAVKRRSEGQKYFYSIEASNPSLIELKKFINLFLLEPLVEKLKNNTNRILLFGNCAQGTDTCQGDLDLFVVTSNRESALDDILKFKLPRGFEDIHIQPVIRSPVDLIEANERDKAFIKEVDKGIVLWEKVAGECKG